jgi:RNA polymerase sigma-70 factor (ECF subfamily)
MKARASVQPRTLLRKRAGETVSVQKDQESREDEALLIAVGNSQDREAFNALFHRFSGKIFALGMKITRNDQLANDLVQEAMLIIWQKAPLYDLDKGSAQTWIFTLVRNRCFDILRKMKRQPEGISADDIYAETEYELSVDPEQEQSTLIPMDQISQYFELLPAAQREVIEYVFMRDLTHQEAAQQLDIPLGTLKSRLRLALNKLRDYIGVEE